MSITVEKLTKKYGAQVAVNAISFSAASGEIVGFLGPNGAGKSTTMKMITGFLEADGGNIMVCGKPVHADEVSTKKMIGYLPESNPLYMDMYVREYLFFVAGIHGFKNKKDRVEEVIHTVGLQAEAGKKIGQLSKGYKQRVGLAAAIIHQPEVLILDEPTSGLDPNQIIEIREVIKALGKEKTVLLSSHIMQEVEALCDRVIVINKGNIVADDQLVNLKKRNTGENYLLVSFKQKVAAEILKNIGGCIGVNSTADSFKIVVKDIEAYKRGLLQYCISNNIDINSMQQGSNSMEEVFKELTKEG